MQKGCSTGEGSEKALCIPEYKLSSFLLHKSLIFRHFNYCLAVWHNCGYGNAVRLERTQLRALRFVYNDNISASQS